MLSVVLFLFAALFTFGRIIRMESRSCPKSMEIFLSYILFFNMGIMGILTAYAHIFNGPETARLIGWQPGSPFQFEIGIANLSYGVLGILAYWMRGRFWEASAIGWSTFLLGSFIGHLNEYCAYGNSAPYNIGVYVWVNDLFLPLLVLILLGYIRRAETKKS